MKIAKLSLVAAVAVAGFTTANAQPLEEAIKNVDVSGSVVYRYNDASNDASNNGTPVTTNPSSSNNNYKVGSLFWFHAPVFPKWGVLFEDLYMPSPLHTLIMQEI